MRVVIKFSNDSEVYFDKAIDCELKDGFLHVYVLYRKKRKEYGFNVDDIRRYTVV